MAAMKLKHEKLLEFDEMLKRRPPNLSSNTESSFSFPISPSTLNFSFAYCPQATGDLFRGFLTHISSDACFDSNDR
jgi:hypothetical protein